MFKKVLLIFVPVLVIVFVAFFWLKSTNKTMKDVTEQFKITQPLETPIPFADLTIPHLRDKNFQSQLDELEQISQNTNYTSYLTSYDSDGFKINALLTIPNTQMPSGGYPAIVFIHGYIPPQEYSTTQNYGSYVDYLASRGFVVFKIDLRGHGLSEGTASGAYYSGSYVIDTLNAYSALEQSDFVNSQKIGLWAHSMGGNIAFRSMIVKQNIPATVIWAGAVYTYLDLGEYGISDNSYQPPTEDSPRRQERNRLRALYGDFDSESLFWQSVVPTNYLRGVTGALQINHAINDSVVSVEFSRNLQTILGNSDIIFELNEYTSGGHNIAGNTFTQAMQNTVRFFENYLR